MCRECVLKPFFCKAMAVFGLALGVGQCAAIQLSGSAVAAGSAGHEVPRVHRFATVSRSTGGTARIIRASRARISMGRTAANSSGVRIVRFGRSAHVGAGVRMVHRHNRPFSRFAAFALPEQIYFPPYYRADRAYVQRPDMKSRLKGGLTARQGSPWRSEIRPARTVEQGARLRGTIRSARTVEQGSRYRSRIAAGRMIEKGSPWASTMRNWRFSGYAAPVRPKGIPYYRSKRRGRSPWASRLY